MIDAAQRAQIRRLFYAEHWRIGTISAELGVHHDAVRNAIESERFIRPGTQVRPTMLDAYKGLVGKILDDYPRLRATRVFEMIRVAWLSGLGRAAAPLHQRHSAPAQPRRSCGSRRLPGEQAQVDWGTSARSRSARRSGRLSCFVMVLSWSRAIYARFALDQTLETFMRGHVQAFDRPRRGAARDPLRQSQERRPRARRRPRPVPPAHPRPRRPLPLRAQALRAVPRQRERQGRATDPVPPPLVLRRAALHSSVEDLNAQLARWISEIAHVRRAPRHADGRTVGALLVDEQPRLLPLPEHPLPCGRISGVASGKTPVRPLRPQRLLDPAHAREEAADAVADEHDGPTSRRRHRGRAPRAQLRPRQGHRGAGAHRRARSREAPRARPARSRPPAQRRASTPTRLLDAARPPRREPRRPHRAPHSSCSTATARPSSTARSPTRSRAAPLGAASVAHILDQRARAPASRCPRSTPCSPTIHVSAISASRHTRSTTTTSSTPPIRCRPPTAIRRTVMTHARRALRSLGLASTAAELDDLVALATKQRWSPTQLLEHVAEAESNASAPREPRAPRRSQQARCASSRIADFDWAWPKRIDREAVEAALRLDFLGDARNVVLVAPQGLGKTMIAQNIAHAALLAGHSALFVTAVAAPARPRRPGIRARARPPAALLRDASAARHRRDRLPLLRHRNADLLFQVVSRRLRAQEPRADHQPRLQRLADHLPERHVRHRAHRPRRPPRRDHRHRGRELPPHAKLRLPSRHAAPSPRRDPAGSDFRGFTRPPTHGSASRA